MNHSFGLPTSVCRQCGRPYIDRMADQLCGRCKAREKLGLPPLEWAHQGQPEKVAEEVRA